MKDAILKERIFKITTYLGNREIHFMNNFQDPEFDSWDISQNQLILKKENNLIKYSYDGSKFIGRDWRGGYSEIMPYKPKEFKKLMKINREKEKVLDRRNIDTYTINRKTDIAVISDFPHKEYDTYQVKRDVFHLIDLLFQSGYSKVCYLTTSVNGLFVDILNNAQNITNADFVQGSHDHNLPKANFKNLHEETGDWKNFIMTQKSWGKVREFAKGSLSYAFTKACQQYKMKRLALSKDRTRSWLPSDGNIKNFEIAKMEDLK